MLMLLRLNFMTCFKIFRLLVIFSSFPGTLSDLPSSQYVTRMTAWRNNDKSFPQQTRFTDGSIARFILLNKVENYHNWPEEFGFGYCFYCSSSFADSCYLSILLVGLHNKTEVVLDIPPQVVWSANPNHPVGENAILGFSRYGEMILENASDGTVWTSSTTGKFVSSMCIDKKGNMALLNQTEGIVWQSFDYPTDTLLQGQAIRRGQRLISSISSANLSHGMFYVRINYLALSAFVETDKTTKPYMYMDVAAYSVTLALEGKFRKPQLKLVQFHKGNMTFIYEMGFIKVSMPLQTAYTSSIQFLKLDADGGVRVYGWDPQYGWIAVYVVGGQDECQLPLKCGRYGLCLNGQCTCPVGVDGMNYFTPIDTRLPQLGCHQLPLSSSTQDSTPDQYQLVHFGNLSYFAYFDSTAATPGLNSEESCKKACLDRATCKAVFFREATYAVADKCYLLSEVLSIIGTTPVFDFYKTSAYLKVKKHPSPYNKSWKIFVFMCVLGLLLVSACTLLVKKKKKSRMHKDYLKKVSGIPRFSYSEICTATTKFKHELGGGGFGKVFKGVLRDGTEVAVKRLENIGQGTKEFLAEVETIGQIHHNNLVRLVGFCAEKRHRMLVYEYMSNGSLAKWIFSEDREASLNLQMRKKILLDIAKGLAYLHEDCRQRIVHLDVKPQNILLSDNFDAKLSDFGMSKLIDRNESQVITGLRGTIGYLAPEWQYSRITVKADTYSFGIVLLEVVIGRKNLDYSQPESDVHLPTLLRKISLKKQLVDLIECHNDDIELHELEEAIEMVRLGLWCVNCNHTRRPPMSLVVKILEGEFSTSESLGFQFNSF